MRTAIVTMLIVLGSGLARAQEPPVVLSNEIRALSNPTPGRSEEALVSAIRDNFWKAVYISDQGAINASQKDVNEILTFRRADIQAGAGAGSSGTTSAIASPLLPAIFGAAFEDGAIIRTVSGTTITFKINPAGLLCAADPAKAAAVARRDDDGCGAFWRGIGATLSFDTSRGNKNTELTKVQTLQSQFAAAGVRGELINRRKATGAQYLRTFREAFDRWRATAEFLANANLETGKEDELEQALVALVGDPRWKTLKPDERVKQVTAIVAAKAKEARVADQTKADVRSAWLSALRTDRALQNAVLNAPVLTVEYTFQRPDLATEAVGNAVPPGTRPPSLHTGRVIYAQGYKRLNLDFTSNASVSLFADKRAGMSDVFRDFRLGIEGKFTLRELANYGAPTLSFAGLFVHLHQPALGLGLVVFNDTKVDKPGNIGVFQTKLEFPTARNSIRIPLSFTYSNRTELIKESDVRGQIGLTFNLDGLFGETK